MPAPTQAQAVEMLQGIIDKGRGNAARVIQEIQESRPQDAVVTTDRLTISDTLTAIIGQTELQLHDNAIVQAMSRADIPVKYGRHLQSSDWGRRLLAQSFNEILHHEPQRVLLRMARGQLMAFLSDSYRRLDAAPIVDAFAAAVDSLGGVPVDGVLGDLRLSIRAIVPEILWVGNDPVVVGAEIQTSDYGRGQLAVRAYTLRPLCTNGQIGENILRAIHLGRRIEREMDTFSQRTHDLDTATMASAVGDLVSTQLGPAAIAARKAALDKAAGTEIDPKTAFAELKKVMTRSETDAAAEVFAFGDESQVPAGRNAWRLSNAVSWVAKSAEPERRLDLERIAGELLATPTARAAALEALIQ